MIGLGLVLLSSFTAVGGDGLRLEFDDHMRSRLVASLDGEVAVGPYTYSEALLTAGGELREFAPESREEADINDALGPGHEVTITGRAGSILKRVEVSAYRSHPHWLFMRVRYTNEGTSAIQVLGYINNRYEFAPARGQNEPAFWSYQSASYESRPDWVLPIRPNYQRGNYLGMNNSDYGGGTPVLDVWRRDLGVAIGHLELTPKLVSLPVHRHGQGNVELALSNRHSVSLAPGASLDSVRSFVSVHHGDHFATLRDYATLMQAQGLSVSSHPEGRVRTDLVRVGVRARFYPATGFRQPPGGQAAGLPLGRAR